MREINDGYAFSHVVQYHLQGMQVGSERPMLSEYLARRFPHGTQSQWLLRIIEGEIGVNDVVIARDEPIRNGSKVVWNRPGWIEEPVPLQYDLLFEDDQLIAVSKPSGLPTLPGGGFYRHTLLHLVQSHAGVVFPLHRLGRATSGVVLFAKTKSAASRLSANWSGIDKLYLALASGTMVHDEYDICASIGPVKHSRLGTVHAADPNGKKAQSIARVIERRPDSTLVQVDLKTGRPHQIRIHLAYVGHPLVGDPLYDVGGIPRSVQPGLPGDPGYHLHAKRLSIIHPTHEQPLTFVAPEPELLRPRSTNS